MNDGPNSRQKRSIHQRSEGRWSTPKLIAAFVLLSAVSWAIIKSTTTKPPSPIPAESAIINPSLPTAPATESMPADLTSWQKYLKPVQHRKAASETEQWIATDGYLGMKACQQCHEDRFDSYSKSLHTHSFRQTDAASEPKGAEFYHAPSFRQYQIYAEGKELRHREILMGSTGEKIAVTDYPMKFTVGSGTHAHTYLTEVNGFLVESPVSWYHEVDQWKMSPGYDKEYHSSFERTPKTECVFCHVGQVEVSAESPMLFNVTEHAISCERCHGPGESHLTLFQNRKNDPDAPAVEEHTETLIVHPGKLSREKSEAVCQQCHLQGVTTIGTSGDSVWGFRPGQKITENRTDFRFAGKEESKIVGHVEQLHQSRCYTETETLTCITCHDPHQPVPVEDQLAYHRDNCLQCHFDDSCGVDIETRLHKNTNDCAACHMSKLPTDVVHAALHHHRIGIFPPEIEIQPMKPFVRDGSERLIPIIEDADLDPFERTRREYFALLSQVSSSQQYEAFRPQLESLAKDLFAPENQSRLDPQLQVVSANDLLRSGKKREAYLLLGSIAKEARSGSR